MTGSAIVVLAAGAGSRVGAEMNKVLLPLDGIPLLAHSVRTALEVEDVHRIVVVVRPEDRDQVAAALAPYLGAHDVWLVDGGAERHDSETRALEALRPDIESGEIGVVAIHDGARPLASAALFRTAIDVAQQHGAAVPALGATGLVALDGAPVAGDLVGVQTPQAFRAPELLTAYSLAATDGFVGTDTAACLERYTDVAIHAVDGEAANLKVTFPEDLALATELVTSANG
ncbi:IspD/TarI family cytidylyltransferase [Nocardioides marmorisolisilvae]|uniref:2-C-methyl-D-erythritol 4-phosphate cytidylyltransferase n=1 Tax=Nocardioides marmorisolisilvae TaxID=1542737 RepID=A0A3N0DPT1_9ACTN|nr:IspD/TarI family cytidylyltransferase [Nocardioides marmorisolisilvae]RNL77456.1 2-C-methyl-D-erythritol 4-phosphate cytidylyltransferase [Nocardioides marmorisolisilvae]